MAVTVLAMVSINEDEPQALARYLDVIDALMERADAKVIQRFKTNKVAIDGPPAKIIILIEYPDQKALDLVYQSQEYRAAKPIRDIAFSSHVVCVVGDA